ncbi:PhaM family polyhydroxyalkanoate granule multifunctional regulatory protein [Variovorax sp. HJSM1_2]|uniref:PhaM family polyhydroxyalkanoate granule multifunctional regulatory protein n=1 Tax=Variovorax sp. HJSM1_2 TaxID=3366263 RepID=UPI003BC00B5B
MSSTPGFDFSKFVPGFDFLQNLAEQATQKSPKMPNLGHWVAPTINVEELEKRIEELKAVQFWLDQNAAALKATIQALEVQKMTLATLRGMNFSMGDLADAFKIKTPVAEPPAPAPAAASAPSASSMASAFEQMQKAAAAASAKFAAPPEPEAAPPAAEPESSAAAAPAAAAASAGSKPAGVIDPLHWWNALATQFQQIAASAVSESALQKAVDDSSQMAASFAKEAMKSAEVLSQGVKAAARAGKPVARSAPRSTGKAAASGVKPAAKSAAGAVRQPAAKAAGKTAAKPAKKGAAPARKRAR